MSNTIDAWSYSRYSTFKQCPYRAKLLYIDKLKEPDNDAMHRGSQIHSKIEDFLLGVDDTLDPCVKGLKSFIYTLRGQPNLATELEWAVDKEGAKADWFSKDAWLRAKADAVWPWKGSNAGSIIDFKTGRQYHEHIEQAELYAVVAHLVEGWETVRVGFWYVDNDETTSVDYNLEELKGLKTKWFKRGQYMCERTEFERKKSSKCRWCFFNAANAGLCVYK